ncbi:MAG: hypothetical protein WB711_21340 [Terriglobales bacterium]
MILKRSKAGSIFCIWVLTAVWSQAAAAQLPTPKSPIYKVIELPLRRLYINDSGEVVGMVQEVQLSDKGVVLGTGKRHAALWTEKDGLRILPTMKGYSESEARGYNQAGHAVGWAIDSSDERGPQAFIYQNRKLVALPGHNSKALAINDSDDIVGQAIVKGTGPAMPVLWHEASVRDLGGCCGGVANAINKSGQVVGNMYDQNGQYRAFLWDQSRGIKYFGAADNDSTAVSINERGHVLVQEFDSGVFIYEGKGTAVRVKIPTSLPVQARSINGADVVVGDCGAYSDVAVAFRWDETNGYRDLNTLIPTGSGWRLESATSINNRGQIVGVGEHDEKNAGYLLMEQDHGH